MSKIILASTSAVHDKPYLSYLFEEIKTLFSGIDEVLFIPYARPGGLTYEAYTDKVKTAFSSLNIDIKGIHEFANPAHAIQQAKGFFTGGGNTFLLLKTLYDNQLLDVLAQEIKNGKPYLGTSAGSNIGGKSIMNTNDMPIVYPPSFQAMGLIPFNINPHYLDPNPDSTHMGETRETRIKEYLEFNSIPVIGLREGSWIEVSGVQITLKGELMAKWFEPHKNPIEIAPNSILGMGDRVHELS
jgi:dipeptidase E